MEEIYGKGVTDGALAMGLPLFASNLGGIYLGRKTGKREGYEEGYNIGGEDGYEAGYNKGLDAKDISDIYPYLISGGLGAGLGALLSSRRRGLGALIGGAAGGALPLLYKYYKDNYANK